MKRSKFSLSHYKLYSCDMGELIPNALVEVLPGDTVQAATSALVRASPLLAPVMHPVHVRQHWWFVPHRLVWDGWEDFITGGPDGLNVTEIPWRVTGGAITVGSLADYLGVPVGLPVGQRHSVLPYRGYQLIWNEFYRDQDLQAPVVVSRGNGIDTTTFLDLQNVCWEKDYFTSARPWEQKGPAVNIPIAGTAPVTGIGMIDGQTAVNTANVRWTDGTVASRPGFVTNVAGSPAHVKSQATGVIGAGNKPDVFADLSSATGITINDLREALAIQRFEEARARYGSRYVEYLRYLGVRSSDARLQRPEYLGGGKQTIQFSEVLQTAEGANAVGTLRGHGITALRSRRFRRFFEEHGYVFGLMSVKPRTMYSQGTSRTWNRRVKEDFWQKELEHIGQQEVLNREIYAQHATPDGVFGYQDRYDEYRRAESSVAGEFRTNTLNHWHFAREFASDPALNATFVKSVPTERTFASAATDVLYIMAMHSIHARRMLTRSGTSFTF